LIKCVFLPIDAYQLNADLNACVFVCGVVDDIIVSASCLAGPVAASGYSGDREYAVSGLVKEGAYSFDTVYLRSLCLYIAAPDHNTDIDVYLFNRAGDVCVATINLRAGSHYLGPIIQPGDLHDLNLLDLEVNAIDFATAQEPVELRFELRLST